MGPPETAATCWRPLKPSQGSPLGMAVGSAKRGAWVSRPCLTVLWLSRDLAQVKELYERKMRELVASATGAGEIQQLKQKQELKVEWALPCSSLTVPIHS